MSRTKKGSKGSGWEYWGKRPLVDAGRQGKQIGIQRERANLKTETYNLFLDVIVDPDMADDEFLLINEFQVIKVKV